MRILVFQTAYLGDVVLTTPLLRTLKTNLPKAHVACALRPEWAPVIRHGGLVDEIIGFDKRGADSGLGGSFRLARRLRDGQFDAVLCPHPSFRSGMILAAAKIPMRIGFQTSAGAMFFTKKIPHPANSHEVLRVLSMARALGIDRSDWIDEPQVAPDPDIDPDRVLERCGINAGQGGLVGVHPGSVWATKRWLPSGFAEVCKTVAGLGAPVVVFGTESEQGLVDEVVRQAGRPEVVACTGLGLDELIAVYSRLSIYITNDSGPMHIAAALGVPVVSIFGSTVPAQGYAPYSKKAVVIEAERLDCRPCGPHGFQQCPREHFLCMKKVHPKSVLLAIRVLLGGFSGTGFEKALHSRSEGI